RFVERAAGSRAMQRAARTAALTFAFCGDAEANLGRLGRRCIDRRLAALVMVPSVHYLLAVDRLIDDLIDGNSVEYLAARFDPLFIHSAGQRLRENALAYDRLTSLIAQPDFFSPHATIASLLVAADRGWMPQEGVQVRLAGAQLQGAAWRGAHLVECDLTGADLSCGDPRDARMDR